MMGRNGHSDERPDDGDEEESDKIIRFPTFAERMKRRLTASASASKKNERLINLPPVTAVLAGTLIAVHLAATLFLGPVEQYWLFSHFGFIPAQYTSGDPLSWSAFASPLTYALLHGGWMHLFVNVILLAAFGTGTERWIGGRKFIFFFVSCSLASALIHFALNPFSAAPVIGASGGLSGLFAAILVLMQRAGRTPAGRYGLWPVILLWVVVSAVFGLIGGPGGENIAWAAHIGGFLAGFGILRLMKV